MSQIQIPTPILNDDTDQRILTEELFTEAIDTILRRQFFPELGKMKAKRAVMEAMESGDPDQLEHARCLAAQAESTLVGNSEEALETGDLGLDDFMKGHKSEDMESFRQLVQEESKERRKKYPWLFPSETLAIKDKSEDEGESAMKELEFTRAALMLPPAPRKNKRKLNSVMMIEDVNPDAKKARKEINYSGTQIDPNLFVAPPRRPPTNTASGNSSPGGFNLVATPRYEPGEENFSPLVTWGQVEGTPTSLPTEGKESSLSSFTIAEGNPRDQIGRKLAEDTSRRLREEKRSIRKAPGTPQSILSTPRRSRSRTPGTLGTPSALTPAATPEGTPRLTPQAMKFAQQMGKISANSIFAPRTPRSSTGTPRSSMGTPRSAMSTPRGGATPMSSCPNTPSAVGSHGTRF